MNGMEPQLRRGIVLFESTKYPREYIEIPLLYSIGDQNEDYPNQVEDLVEGGILIYVKDKLDMGERLDIEIFPPEYFGLQSIKAVTKIVWTPLQGLNEGEEHEYGLKFIGMDTNNILRLNKLLNHLDQE